jgi:ABC-type glycerol-3-phosphate transport system permease component
MTTSSKANFSGRGLGKQGVLYAILAVVLLWTLVPILWMVLSSFKPGTAQLSPTPVFFFAPTLQHYAALFTGGNAGLPRRLRAGEESLQGQATRGVLDHLDEDGPDSRGRPAALYPVSLR